MLFSPTCLLVGWWLGLRPQWPPLPSWMRTIGATSFFAWNLQGRLRPGKPADMGAREPKPWIRAWRDENNQKANRPWWRNTSGLSRLEQERRQWQSQIRELDTKSAALKTNQGGDIKGRGVSLVSNKNNNTWAGGHHSPLPLHIWPFIIAAQSSLQVNKAYQDQEIFNSRVLCLWHWVRSLGQFSQTLKTRSSPGDVLHSRESCDSGQKLYDHWSSETDSEMCETAHPTHLFFTVQELFVSQG